MAFKHVMMVGTFMHGLSGHARSMTVTLLQGHMGRQRQKFKVELSLTTKQATSIKLARTVSLFCVCDHDFENVYTA